MNDNPCRLLDLKRIMDQARCEVERVGKSLLEESGRFRDKGKNNLAKEVDGFSEKLQAFADRFEAVGAKWKKLETGVENQPPELKLFFQTITQKWKTAHGHETKEGLKVTFPNGQVVEGPIASATFAKTIEKLSPGLIAYEHFELYGKPLVIPLPDKDHTVELPGNWFLQIPESTKEKATTLQKLSRLLDARLKVEVVAGTFANVNRKA